MSQPQTVTTTQRRVWVVTVIGLLVTVVVPYIGLLVGAGTANFAHRHSVVVARNILIAAVLVMAVFAVLATPVTVVTPS